jgi:hypothetical protein
LAIVVRSCCGNEGKIVRCIRVAGRFNAIYPNGSERFLTWWEIDRGVTDWSGILGNEVPDEDLRPISPGDVTDEEVRDLYAPDRSMKDSPPSDTTSPSEKKETV